VKVFYIAGPYKAQSEYQVRLNIRNAEIEALWVWFNGGVALCPHKNISGFGGANEIRDEVWLAGNLEMLKRCDALYAIGKYKESDEAGKEIQFAMDNRIPVFTSRVEIMNYLTNYSILDTSEAIQNKVQMVN
jgi:hypothetical protein